MDKKISEIKKELFLYRNGIIATQLKQINSPFPLIYGLLLPQIKEIASNYSPETSLALELWKSKECRETRLIAIYLFPVNKIQKEITSFLIKDLMTKEEAEILSFKILRYLPYANEILEEIQNSKFPKTEISDHLYLMLKRNLESL